MMKARYFLGLAAEQDGQKEQAAGIWRQMLAQAPRDAGWVDFVRASLARVEGRAVAGADGRPETGPAAPPQSGPRPGQDAGAGPSREDMAAASQLTEEQRNEMVRGMVQRLADRLKENGDDLDGWLRLMRAYMVMGDRDKARATVSDARKALGADPEKLRRVNDVAKSLGLEG
jgi:cytochrome c-type biogenesis protein CcmH